MDIIVEQEIKAPRSVVYNRAIDIPNAAAMIPAILKIEPLTEGQPKLGWRWRETRKMFGKEATEEMWFTEIQENSHYVVEAESNGCHYTTQVWFEEKDASTTNMKMVFITKPVSFFAWIISPLMLLMRGTIVKCFADDMLAIKQVLETKSA